MKKNTGWGAPSWLPPKAARAYEADDARERALIRQEEIARRDHAVQRAEEAVVAAAVAAQGRGEVVFARQLVSGEGLGRTPAEIVACAFSEMDRSDARAARRERRRDGDWEYLGAHEPVIHASRSAWPESEYQVERMVRQAEDDRTWMAGYQMRAAARRGQGAEHIARERAEAEARHLQRSQPTSHLTSYSEISR